MAGKISRRTLLRGAGAAISLPWLESIAHGGPAPAGQSLSEPPLRMAFLFIPNGLRPDYWTPAGDGEDYQITPHLKPLESLKNEFLLIENLWHKNTVGRKRALAESASLAFRRVCGTDDRKRSRLRRHDRRPICRPADRCRDAVALVRVRIGPAADGNRHGRRRIRASLRRFPVVVRSPHAGTERDCPSTGF
jgi:Protein of unknown function (DUF1552)